MSESQTKTLTDVGKFMEKHGFVLEFLPVLFNPSMTDTDLNHWQVKIGRSASIMSWFFMSYSKGSAHRRWIESKGDAPYQSRQTVNFMNTTEPAPPNLPEILECLQSDFCGMDEQFADWANNLGWDADSIKARDCYMLTQKNHEQFLNIFGRNIMDELFRIEF